MNAGITVQQANISRLVRRWRRGVGMALLLAAACLPWRAAAQPVEVVGQVEWPETWTVFGPVHRDNPVVERHFLTAVPETLEVPPLVGFEDVVAIPGQSLEPREIQPDGPVHDLLAVVGGEVGSTAYVYLVLRSPVAQAVTLGMGADWWLQAWVNGEEVVNSYGLGNEIWPPDITNFPVIVDLEEGDNILAVRFSRGRGSAALALGGPERLRLIPEANWNLGPLVRVDAAAELAANAGFEQGGSGDPWVPAEWHNGTGEWGYAPGELVRHTANPISGTQSLEINTLGTAPGRKRVLYTRLNLVAGQTYRISYRARRLSGEGNVTVMLREDPYGGMTYFLEGGRIGPDKDRELIYSGHKPIEHPAPYLVIYTYEPAHVILDDLSITPGAFTYSGWREQKVAWSFEDWDAVTGEVSTPHLPWARPLAGGDLRILSMMLEGRQRWTVEMAQRMGVEFEAVSLVRDWQSVYPERGYWTLDRDGDPVYVDIVADSLEKLARDWDCVIVSELAPSALTEAQTEALLAGVRSGGGLVLRGARLIGNRGAEAQGRAVFLEGAWSDALNEAHRMREPEGWAALGTVSGETAQFYRYGEGRIAVLGALETDGDLYVGFEHEMAHTLKAVLWASGRTPAPHLARISLPGAQDGLRAAVDRERLPAGVEVALSGPVAEGGMLSWWLGDEHDPARIEGSVSLPAGAALATIELPRLPGGRHSLGLRLSDSEGRALDWTSARLEVGARPEIAAVELTREPGEAPYYFRGEEIRGAVRLEGDPGAGRALRIRLGDLDGRLWDERELTTEAGRIEYTFALSSDGTMRLLNRVSARLLDPGGGETVAARASREVTVIPTPKDRRETLFGYHVWYGQDYFFDGDYLGALIHRHLGRDHGITETFQQGRVSAERGRSRALADIRFLTGCGDFFARNQRVVGSADAPVLHRPITQYAHRHEMQQALTDPESTHYVGEAVEYAPIGYMLGHEDNIRGHLANVRDRVDICFSPHTLGYLRRILQNEYRDLSHLNAVWGTSFADWSEVRPLTLPQALEAGRIAPWVDHRRVMDRAFADWQKAKVEAARSLDPHALGVFDNVWGSGGHNSWDAADWWLLLDGVFAGSGLAYLTDFVPEERRHLIWQRSSTWGPQSYTGHRDLLRRRFGGSAWNMLLTGHRSFGFWYSYIGHWTSAGRAALPPFTDDLRMTPFGRVSAKEIARIREGVDRMVYESRRDTGGIGLYYSRASTHVCTAWQAMHGQGDLVEALHPSGSKGNFFMPTLQRAGRNYRSVAYGQVAQGILREGDVRVLVLPFSQAIADEEVEEIRAFVRRGGLLLADIRPGMSDQHGHTDGAGRLDDVFGVRHRPDWNAYQPVRGEVIITGRHQGLALDTRIEDALLGPALELNGATALGVGGNGTPVVLVHDYGEGRAVLLNFSLVELGVQANEVSMLFDGILSASGIGRLIEIEPLQEFWESRGDRILFETVDAYGREAIPSLSRHMLGSIDLLGFHYGMGRGLGRQRLRVTPPRAGHVYDLMEGAYLGRHRAGFEVEVPLEGQNVYAVLPYQVEAPRLTVQFSGDTGETPVLDCRVRLAPHAAAAEKHVVRLRLFAPDGTEWKDFAVNVLVEGGETEHRIRLPRNAPAGEWRVEAAEAISRLSAAAHVLVP